MEAPELSLTGRAVARPALRAAILAILSWVPLLVLTLAFRDVASPPTITFFEDLSAHVRFFLVLPVLLLADAAIGPRTRTVMATFLTAGLVRPEARARFEKAVETATSLVRSLMAAVILAVLTSVVIALAVRRLLRDEVVFWFERTGADGQQLTPAGWWYVLASGLVVFLFLRWAWRYGLWCWLLRRVSRFDLHLAGSHPDRAGGLGFVNIGHAAFALIAFAGSSQLAAGTATEILQAGVPLSRFQNALISFVALSIVVGLIPLPTFRRALMETRRAGIVAYGTLATQYAHAFEAKWMGATPPPADEPLLGTSDIQSLADIGGSFERLLTMKPTPIDKRTVLAFAVASALPLLPLALVVMPLEDIVKMLVRAIM